MHISLHVSIVSRHVKMCVICWRTCLSACIYTYVAMYLVSPMYPCYAKGDTGTLSNETEGKKQKAKEEGNARKRKRETQK